ncbi:hypothetical protein ACWGFX_25240 [Streptomyces xanthophaeus]
MDETLLAFQPSLADRIALMRPQITRLRADIACFKEVHGQERPGQPRALLALKELLVGTNSLLTIPIGAGAACRPPTTALARPCSGGRA